MNYQLQYIEFWRHLYNQLEDLYGYMPFEDFLSNPWQHLARLRRNDEQPGLLLAYMNQRLYLSSEELPKLEGRLDLDEITCIAEEVIKVGKRQVRAVYRLH